MHVCLNSAITAFAVPPSVSCYPNVWGDMINITKCRNIQSASFRNQNSRAKQQAKPGDRDRLCHILHLQFWCGFEISYAFSLMSRLSRDLALELEFSNSFMHLKTALNI